MGSVIFIVKFIHFQFSFSSCFVIFVFCSIPSVSPVYFTSLFPLSVSARPATPLHLLLSNQLSYWLQWKVFWIRFPRAKIFGTGVFFVFFFFYVADFGKYEPLPLSSEIFCNVYILCNFWHYFWCDWLIILNNFHCCLSTNL